MKKIRKEKIPPRGLEGMEVKAFHLWQRRGSPVGDPLTDWLAAEKEREAEQGEPLEEGERRWSEENPQDEEPGEAP